jgi:hypothetical protein
LEYKLCVPSENLAPAFEIELKKLLISLDVFSGSPKERLLLIVKDDVKFDKGVLCNNFN